MRSIAECEVGLTACRHRLALSPGYCLAVYIKTSCICRRAERRMLYISYMGRSGIWRVYRCRGRQCATADIETAGSVEREVQRTVGRKPYIFDLKRHVAACRYRQRIGVVELVYRKRITAVGSRRSRINHVVAGQFYRNTGQSATGLP